MICDRCNKKFDEEKLKITVTKGKGRGVYCSMKCCLKRGRKKYVGKCLNRKKCSFSKEGGERVDNCIRCNRSNLKEFNNHFCKGDGKLKDICAECNKQ